jgi:hypothetical protein
LASCLARFGSHKVLSGREGALGRNWPFVLLLVMGGALLWPAQTAEAEFAAEELDVPRKPNGADAHMPSEMDTSKDATGELTAGGVSAGILPLTSDAANTGG